MSRKGIKYKKKDENKKYPGLVFGTPEYRKAVFIKHTYGISIDDYNKMFINQEGRCAICKTHQSELPKGLHIDHCHKTNKVRGLLCFKCNSGIGKLNDDVEILKSAIQYLEN